jgi:cellulase
VYQPSPRRLLPTQLSKICGLTGWTRYVACASVLHPRLTPPYQSTCARLPNSNSPVTSVTSNDVRCNANHGPAASKCSVPAGGTVTIEMHQQNGDRSCANEAIGGAHYGPVLVYMSKVSDASTADGSDPFFKIFQDTWGKNPSGSSGSDDYW